MYYLDYAIERRPQKWINYSFVRSDMRCVVGPLPICGATHFFLLNPVVWVANGWMRNTVNGTEAEELLSEKSYFVADGLK